MEPVYYYEYQSPVGILTLGCIGNEIVSCEFGRIKGIVHKETECLKNAIKQLTEYFEGKRQEFDLQYRFIIGTAFQQKVWQALLTIPYGKTVSYKDIAEIIDSPKACRAVGGANNKNPIAIFVPCHRVIGTNQKLVGYGGGLEKKEYLLELEKRFKER